MQLSKMEERATAIAERHYGADSVELAPYLYDEALAAAYIGLALRFGRVRIAGIEGIELDPEHYEVWLVHDKGFLQQQMTF